MVRFSIFISFILAVCGIMFATTFAHAQSIVWQKALGGTADEYTMSIIPAHDSGYVIGCQARSADGDVTSAHGGFDYWAVKVSEAGHIIWQKSYGGTGNDFGMRIKATADGGYIMIGGTRSADGDITQTHGAMDVWVVKVDGNGDKEWQKTYGGSGDDFGYDIQQTYDGGYIIGGYTASPDDGDVMGFHGGTGDCWVLKIDDTGALNWQKAFGGSGEDGVIVIRQTDDTGYIAGGYTKSVNNGDVTNYHGGTWDGGDSWVVKLSKSGSLEWQKTYGGSLEEQVFDIIPMAGHKYIVGNSTRSVDGDVAHSLGNVDGWIFELDDTGGIIWQKNYGTGSSEHITALCRTPDNGFVFTGWNADLWLGKIDSTGNLEWQKSFGGSGSEAGWAIGLANGGGYIIAGSTSSNDADVTGYHGGASDVWVLKVSQPAGISNLSGNASPLKVYPNPATRLVHIEQIESNTSATLYNAWGQAVKSWQLKPGNTTLHISELPSGIYQLQLVNSEGERKYGTIIKLY